MSQMVEIPDVGRFRQQGLTLGAKWARWMDANPTFGFGLETQVWYYDGGRVFLQLSDMLGDSWNGLVGAVPLHDPSWYAYEILRQYEDMILAKPVPPGVGTGWRLFPYGMTMAAWRQPWNEKHRLTLLFLVKNSSYIAAGLPYLREHGPRNWCPWNIRESAYVVDILLAYLAHEGIVHPLLQDAVYDCVVADLRNFFTPGSSTYLGTSAGRTGMSFVNNFMLGLALESLIHYYGLTGDEEILPIIKLHLDNFWEFCVEKEDPFDGTESFAQYYNSDPINGAAKGGLMMPDGSGPVRFTSSSLNQLVSAAFAWYWLHSGDQEYQERGDKFWSAGVLGAGHSCPQSKTNQDYTFTGKQFNQNYKAGFDYLQWRNLPVSTTTEQNNPPQGAQRDY